MRNGLSRVSFSLPNRLFRALWLTAWTILGAWTPPPLHPWRRLILLAFGGKIAPGARVYASARIWYPPNLRVGSNAVIGPGASIYCQATITIGERAVISQGAQLVTGTHDVDGPGFALVTKPITIGADAWVAASAFVGPGVTLGEGAVLGACGVTFKDLPAWTIHAGNPARMLRQRRCGETATSP